MGCKVMRLFESVMKNKKREEKNPLIQWCLEAKILLLFNALSEKEKTTFFF